MEIPDELNYTTSADTNIAIIRAMGEIRFMQKMEQLMPLVAQELVKAGVDFSKVVAPVPPSDTSTGKPAQREKYMTKQVTPNESIDRAFPLQGLCVFCGTDDARHRTIDAIADRHKAGESISELAKDYDLPEESIRVAIESVPVKSKARRKVKK